MQAVPSFKAPRTHEQITNEYQNLALKAGDLGYKIECFEKDLEQVYEQMRNLNFEFVAANNAKAEAENAAKAAAAKPVVSVVADPTPVLKEEG
jgi:hypothetical protein